MSKVTILSFETIFFIIKNIIDSAIAATPIYVCWSVIGLSSLFCLPAVWVNISFVELWALLYIFYYILDIIKSFYK